MLRSERQGVEKQFFELCLEVVNELDLELYDLDYLAGKQELRVFIQNKSTGTVVIDDCMKVDRAMTPYIDDLEWMPEELRLEVSSPGVFRSLTSMDHLQSALEKIVEFSLIKRLDKSLMTDLPDSLNGEKKIRVMLKAIDETSLKIVAEETEFSIDITNIKKASLSPDM